MQSIQVNINKDKKIEKINLTYKKICGIYKITSPSNKVYIGQSIDIRRRFLNYKNLKCTQQVRLHRSLLKYGIDSHVFEIICICLTDDLNLKERYYQDYYNVLEDGLNCVLTNTILGRKILSKETLLKISIGATGRIKSEETLQKMRVNGTGKLHTEEVKQKMRLSRVNYKPSEKCIQASIQANKGKKKGEKWLELSNLRKCKKVIDISNNTIYNSITEASIILKIPKSTLTSRLNGSLKNNTTLIYL